MRRIRLQRRGLAEIVGTLMLVVIVVAAATAFSFFVAAYEKQLEAEESLNHDRALESLKVVGLTEVDCKTSGDNHSCNPNASCTGACFGEVNFTIASLDVNQIQLTALFLDHSPVVNYTAKVRGTVEAPCYNASAKTNATRGLSFCAPLVIPGYSTAVISFNLGDCFWVDAGTPVCNGHGFWALGEGEGPVYASNSTFEFSAVSGLGNQFTETLTPPVALASVFYVSGGCNSTACASIPVFDGLGSYQPKNADNSSVVDYLWNVSNRTTKEPVAAGVGGQFEEASLAKGDYLVSLIVVNSDGLTGSTRLSYDQTS